MNRHLRAGLAVAASALALPHGVALAAPPTVSEFAWRAPVEIPPAASLVRVELPVAALLRLQSRDARDVRIFNAAGEPVAFAFMEPVRAQPVIARSSTYPALPLLSAAPGQREPRGSLQVRIDQSDGGRSVWVQTDGKPPAGATALDSALFTTKGERQPLSALDVQATLPANTPVRISAFSSADLAQWTPLPLRGRLYRFTGEGAPHNTTLEFEQPVHLQDRYLRLDWSGQDGVSVTAVTALIASAPPSAALRGELPAPHPADEGSLEITTGFLTPMAGLALTTTRSNDLLPVRVLGRDDASQPWRLLGQTVVYRLGVPGSEVTNPVMPMHGAAAARLRIVSTTGADLTGAPLRASVEFLPRRLVFVATGAGPFELAAGRADTLPAALPLPTIAGSLGAGKVDDLPPAKIGAAIMQGPGSAGWLGRTWSAAAGLGKPLVLWTVLLAGVLILAGVAWSLLRQMSRERPADPAAPRG